MFYEWRHSINADYWNAESGQSFSFPLHIHACYEFILITEGRMEIAVGENKRVLGRGDAAFVFPYQIHSMQDVGESKHTVCVFSPTLINYYSKKFTGLMPESNFFHVPDSYIELFEPLSGGADIYTVKGILYLFCGLFDRGASYLRHIGNSSDELLYRILEYIEQNFSGDCVLKSLANSLSYDYAYLSRYFVRKIGVPFNSYVNRRRLSKACYLLQTTDMTILEISNECGYNSLRSFNRNFKEQLGISPSEYNRLDMSSSAEIRFSPESEKNRPYSEKPHIDK